MAATIHVFNPPLKPLALYLRLGHSGHRVIEDLHAAGRVKIDRAVVDAAHFEAQKDLVHALRESGVELSLDTKSAEMATLGGLTPRVQALKWASKRPHSPDDFTRNAQRDFVAEIAEYAVAGGMNRVLCPTHSLDGALSPWLRIDGYSCELLRAALDSAGGSKIIESQLQRKSRMIDNTIDVLEDLNETATVPVSMRTAKVLPLSGASGVAN